MTTLTGSHLFQNPNYVPTSLNRYGFEYQHKFEVIARKKSFVFEQIYNILQDLDGYIVQSKQQAWESLCLPLHMELYLKHLGFRDELIESKFYTLDVIYDHIEHCCNHMAEEFVPSEAIHDWWKKARSRARSLSKKLIAAKIEDLQLDDQIAVWQSLTPKYFTCS
jgi:hypothetical protein